MSPCEGLSRLRTSIASAPPWWVNLNRFVSGHGGEPVFDRVVARQEIIEILANFRITSGLTVTRALSRD